MSEPREGWDAWSVSHFYKKDSRYNQLIRCGAMSAPALMYVWTQRLVTGSQKGDQCRDWLLRQQQYACVQSIDEPRRLTSAAPNLEVSVSNVGLSGRDKCRYVRPLFAREARKR